MIDLRYKIVHRLMPATERSGCATACGIKIVAYDPGDKDWKPSASTLDGHTIAVTEKGQPFDCKRCRQVLERHHANKMTA